MRTITILTPTFKRGRDAAMEVFSRGCEPNWDLLKRAHPELLDGFRTTWEALQQGGRS